MNGTRIGDIDNIYICYIRIFYILYLAIGILKEKLECADFLW